MAIERNITSDDDFFLGEDKTLSFTVYQSDGSTAQNITGWALSWMLKKDARDADADAKVTKTTGSGITITSGAAGTLTVTIDDTDTASLAAGVYQHELKRTDDGFETVLTFGTCVLRQSVHR